MDVLTTSAKFTDATSAAQCFDTPEQMLDYERHTLGSAIIDVQALLERHPTGKPAEFYRTIENTLIALQYAAAAARNITRAYAKLTARIEIMEQLLAAKVQK